QRHSQRRKPFESLRKAHRVRFTTRLQSKRKRSCNWPGRTNRSDSSRSSSPAERSSTLVAEARRRVPPEPSRFPSAASLRSRPKGNDRQDACPTRCVVVGQASCLSFKLVAEAQRRSPPEPEKVSVGRIASLATEKEMTGWKP